VMTDNPSELKPVMTRRMALSVELALAVEGS